MHSEPPKPDGNQSLASLLEAKADLDREFAEQQELIKRYGNNRAGRRRAAKEMAKRRKAAAGGPQKPQKPRKRRKRK